MSTQTILILGGSIAGLGAAHYALKHTIPQLPKKDGTTYTVTLVNPSKDFFWRIASPRAAVNKQLMPSAKIFYPIEPAFKHYPKGSFTFIQGTATHVDAAGQTVSITTSSGEQQTIPYTALIIATGMTTASPLFTQTTSASDLTSAYDEFQKSLPNAKTIVIGGAGPVAVETAGEIAEFLNGKPGFMASGPKNPKAKVTIISAEKKMLPVLREAISKQAEKFLKRLGADVVYSTKVVSTTQGESGKTVVQLSDGKTLEPDIYIDATGVRPNTSFLPKEWLDSRNKVQTNPKTLRVDIAGPKIYAIGDVGSYTRGGAIDIGDALPVALTNLKIDLTAEITGKPATQERHYKANLAESQICPIGTSKGVGAFNGNKMPSILIWMIKSRDYLVGQLAQATVDGKTWEKESKWKPEPISQAQKVGLSSG
ncbi:FAD/NAD(P)-binding domain-containing protein [Lojkania enalia]|uniref:FAD/NAD(P)-binding domain-containing protein n=1 Tax=Lojkania enalia TaxID=147567 RepID=A0A9P4K0I3_9PLEO|nr:FAD/NAD(P)-binding domain-containing protein [Didymosphaeria enalia]